MNNGCGCGCSGSSASTQFLNLLRVGPTGDSYEISLGQYASAESSCLCNYQGCGGGGYSASATLPTLITNADQGVLASYSVNYSNSAIPSYYLATTSGASLASNSQVAMVLEQTSPVQPMLRRQDGNFIGTVSSSVGNFMVAFTPSGGTLFTVPNDTPQVATSDGGVIGISGTTYDPNGNADGQVTSPPADSWVGNYYTISSGSLASLLVPYTDYAVIYGAVQGGNLSIAGVQGGNKPAGGGTAVPPGPVIKTFLPFQVSTTSITNAAYIQGLQLAIPVTKATLNFYASQTATLAEFQKQLARRLQAVALISHANVVGTTAIGLCFSTGKSGSVSGSTKNCTVTSQYKDVTPPQGVTLTVVDSFSTSAQIVFLAACDAGADNFRSLWSINNTTKGQAMIIQDVSKFKGGVDLGHAATAWQAILYQLTVGNANGDKGVTSMTVADAVFVGNRQMIDSGFPERWTWVGDGGVTIAHK